jgi:hypothetical protein
MNAKIVSALAAAALATSTHAADQSVPGAWNAAALRIASDSDVARAALQYVTEQARSIHDPQVRRETLDALDPATCVHHRRGVGPTEKQAILASLVAAGFVSASDAAGWGPGALNGVFPPVVDEGTSCPHLPQPFLAAPGGGFHGHHSYPGGLAIHVAMNTRSSLSYAENYDANYTLAGRGDGEHGLDRDLAAAGPLWHDWAKPMVFQWNADGAEFAQMNIAGTGSHHILGLSEAMARGLPADFVVAQASAHSTPSEGNEALVVGWIRAAAIIARVDPLARGYLFTDSAGKLRLPPVQRLGDVDLLAAGQLNLMAEYVLDSLSDGDFILTEPELSIAEALVAKLAPRFGYDPTAPEYNVAYRNVVFAELTAERIAAVYQRSGLDAVAHLVEGLSRQGRI